MERNKGFTLIELLVTIAVIAVLVLLAAPKLLGYTDKAKVTELTVNTREIETAVERYYLDNDDWPRLTDEPYTKEEVNAFSEKIYNITGEEVSLDEDGNYYDIDFDKLKPYIDVPGEKANYILQNPVGKVFYMKNLNETGKSRVNYSNVEEENDNPIPINEPPIDFAYTGQAQTFQAPATGTYELEVWGAQGGHGSWYSNLSVNPLGGNGGYSKIKLTINKGDMLYIYVGGKGQNSPGYRQNPTSTYNPGSSSSTSGGWNGGGYTKLHAGGGGGGATHIAKRPGLLNSLSSYKSDVLVVAGGGGGGGNVSVGGAGGGLIGQTPPINKQFYNRQPGGGGTQNSGGIPYNSYNVGTFGKGANATSDNLNGGGGGGWYGGSEGHNSTGGGGGSSYIDGLIDGETLSGNQSMPNPNGGTMTGNSGHGFARITRVD